MYKKFSELGGLFQIVGILIVAALVLGIIPFLPPMVSVAFGVAEYILDYLIIRKVKDINSDLKDPELAEFHSKLVAGLILAVIALVANQALVFNGIGLDHIINYFRDYGTFPAGTMVTLALVGTAAIIGWIGLFFYYSAYGKLSDFFANNRSIFQGDVGAEASDGAAKVRVGYLMNILAFLIITVLIGLIYYLMGYFKLGNQLKPLKNAESPVSPQPWTNEPSFASKGKHKKQTIEESGAAVFGTEVKKFCPSCGSQLESGMEFCPRCGTKM